MEGIDFKDEAIVALSQERARGLARVRPVRHLTVPLLDVATDWWSEK